MIQSMSAVSGGGLAGRGLGNSIQKFGYLPEDTTDFIFAIICEELGIVGAGLVICLYAMLCLCALSIIRRTTDRFAQLLAIGIVATIGLQALINLAVVTGCGPTKGIALPLISSGGTGWVLTAFCLGLLVSIGRRATDPPADPEAATAPTPPAGTHRLTAAA
jgi:cell division protein FtsW